MDLSRDRIEQLLNQSTLHTKKLSLYLWAEAITTIIYVKNRTAMETLEGSTQYEKWYGEKPFVAHLRIFGSDVYISKDQRSKQKINSEKYLMIN